MSEAAVWGDLTRDALERAYDTARTAREPFAAYVRRFADESAATRDAHPCATISYGPGERETFDLWRPRAPGAPLFFWIHGGYWQRMSKDASSYVAGPIVRAGGAVAVTNYPLAPHATLDEIVRAIRSAYARVREEARAFGTPPERIVVGGHSAGAHLAAMLATLEPVAAIVAVSGIYDLAPLRFTSINDAVAMDDACARRNSPEFRDPTPGLRLVATCGGLESEAFRQQQDAFVRAWRAKGTEIRELEAPEHDHFSIALALADARAPLARIVRETLGLGATP